VPVMVRYRHIRRLNPHLLSKFFLLLPRLLFGSIFYLVGIIVNLVQKLIIRTRRQSSYLKGEPLGLRVVLFLAFSIAILLIYKSPIFKTKNVNILWDNPGFSLPSVENIFKSQTINKSIFLISKIDILKMAKDEPVVKDVSVTKKYPSGLLIEVETREPFLEGRWFNPEKEASVSSLISRDFFGIASKQASGSGEPYLLDKEGVIFWKGSKFGSELPVFFFIDGSTPVPGEKVSGRQNRAGLAFASDLLAGRGPSGFPGLSFLVSDRDQLLVKLAGGPYVFLPHQDSYLELLGSLKLILDKYRVEGKMLKKVDLRFNNPVVEY